MRNITWKIISYYKNLHTSLHGVYMGFFSPDKQFEISVLPVRVTLVKNGMHSYEQNFSWLVELEIKPSFSKAGKILLGKG